MAELFEDVVDLLDVLKQREVEVKWKDADILRLERLLREKCDNVLKLKTDLDKYRDKYQRLRRETASRLQLMTRHTYGRIISSWVKLELSLIRQWASKR